ncbi:hypothetical protein [uncultured Draconibacterium sp.]|uniref:hypothetical protein n=1 Tax=uncultured Draconibacterium sp. TaxID=1573823 RepID=UPI0025F36D4B|nr:hypothetical protein [uncultured Draconibacterium sp.]
MLKLFVKHIGIILFLGSLCSLCLVSKKCNAQDEKFPTNINFDLGTNAFVLDNDDFGFYFGAGYEYFVSRKFALELKGQVGMNSHEKEKPIGGEIVPYGDDYILFTEASYYTLSLCPRFYQELSDIIYFFADVNLGFESSKSNATFGNEETEEENYLGSSKSSFNWYPGFHLGFKVIAEDLSVSFYVGWEKVDLGRSLNDLPIAETGVFEDYSGSTEFLQLGIRLGVPLGKNR